MKITITQAVDFGKEKFDLLQMIRTFEGSKLELRKKVIAHPGFPYRGKYESSRAIEIINKAFKSTVTKPYEVRDTNGGKKNGIWVCWFDFTMVYYR